MPLPGSERRASEQSAALRRLSRFNRERATKLGSHFGSSTFIRSDLVPEEIDYTSASVDQRGEGTDPRRGQHRARSQLPQSGRPPEQARPVTKPLLRGFEAAQACEDPAPIARRSTGTQQLPPLPVPGSARDFNRLAEFSGEIAGWKSVLAELLRHRIAKTRDEPDAHISSQNLLVGEQRVFDRLLPAPISGSIASQENRQRSSKVNPEFGQGVGCRGAIAVAIRILAADRDLFDDPVVQQTKRIVFGYRFTARRHRRKRNLSRIAPQELRILAELLGKDRRTQSQHSLGKYRAQFNLDPAGRVRTIGVGVALDLPHRLVNLLA